MSFDGWALGRGPYSQDVSGEVHFSECNDLGVFQAFPVPQSEQSWRHAYHDQTHRRQRLNNL